MKNEVRPDAELYSTTEAARLLRVSRPVLRRWLKGAKGRPSPVRAEPSAADEITWGEFVSAWFLRGYRPPRNLRALGPFMGRMREAFAVSHPPATGRLFTGEGMETTLRAQGMLPDHLAAVYKTTAGNATLSPVAAEFFTQVAFADAFPMNALRIFPMGEDSPVVIDPEYSFGSPTVRGVRTEVIAELTDAGEDIDRIAGDFSLKGSEARAAVAYEWRLAAAI